MRTNRQLHGEVVKYFYEKRTLFMLLAHDTGSQMLSNEYVSRYYETLAIMNPETRQLFSKMEISLGLFSEQIFTARRYQDVSSVADPMRHVLALLPNLATLVISFAREPPRPVSAREQFTQRMTETLQWLRRYIPPDVSISWDLSTNPAFLGKWLAKETRTQELTVSRPEMMI